MSPDVAAALDGVRHADRRRGRTIVAGRPIRVLIVAPSTAILGGQALEAERLVTFLQQMPELEIGFLPVNPRLPGALRALQKMKYVRTVSTSLAYWAGLLRTVRHYDILHVFSASYWSFLLAPVPALVAGKLHGKRTLLNYRSGEAEDHLARWPLSRRLVRRFDTIVVSSDYLVDVFGAFDLRAHVVPNILDLSRYVFRRRDPLRPVFLSTRNFEPLYNVACTLRAFGSIVRSCPDARLEVVGHGSERSSLEHLAASLRLPNVTFHGKIDAHDMPRFYDAADIFLNSSSIDNMPSSILEAQACGLPVATTNAGGIPHIVDHERTGLLVPCDDHEALAQAAMRFLHEPGLTARVVDGGFRSSTAYSPERVCPLYLEGYRTLASTCGPC
jgi:glycosyltransferase involved in cell wall biosynthesis